MKLKKGQVVAVLCTGFDGRVRIEGDAVVLRVLDTSGPVPRARVRFADGDVVDRWIDPAAQVDDPELYVAQLNSGVRP